MFGAAPLGRIQLGRRNERLPREVGPGRSVRAERPRGGGGQAETRARRLSPAKGEPARAEASPRPVHFRPAPTRAPGIPPIHWVNARSRALSLSNYAERPLRGAERADRWDSDAAGSVRADRA